MKFDDILMTYRKKKEIRSWEETAKALGMTDQGLRHIRKGRGGLKEERLLQIQTTTGIPTPVIVAAWQIEHAEHPEIREAWADLLKFYTGEGNPENNCKGIKGLEECVLC